MRLFKKNRAKGHKPERTCQPRKRTLPTKSEKRLQKRIEGYNAWMRVYKGPEGGYTRPGSLQLS